MSLKKSVKLEPPIIHIYWLLESPFFIISKAIAERGPGYSFLALSDSIKTFISRWRESPKVM